jgi:DNA-binding winged helix-turn-helix (wHTH) protein
MRYVFDDYVLDPQRYEFWCRDERIKLRPKVFQVLTYLIEHRDRVVSKDELLEQLWPDQFIGDGSLNACLMAVRKAVGDSGQSQHHIQTLHGRGYRFVAEVEARTEEMLSPAAPVARPDAASTRLDDPTRSCATCQHDTPPAQHFAMPAARLWGRAAPTVTPRIRPRLGFAIAVVHLCSAPTHLYPKGRRIRRPSPYPKRLTWSRQHLGPNVVSSR